MASVCVTLQICVSEANVKKPVSHGQSQQSILTVDKSNESISSQNVTVCRILNININVQWDNLLRSSGETLSYAYNASDPRPEWALKWLLKKLEPGEAGPGRSVPLQN